MDMANALIMVKIPNSLCIYRKLLFLLLPDLALCSPWYHRAPFMVMLRKGWIMAFHRTDGVFWLMVWWSLAFVLAFNSLAQLPRESGDDQASIPVPPQLECTNPGTGKAIN